MDLDPALLRNLRTLHEAWCASPQPGVSERVRATIAVPGNVALRTRYEAILAAPQSGLGSDAFQVSEESWLTQLNFAMTGDRHLTANRPDLARQAFSALAAFYEDARHPLPLIDAETGLGDAARQSDDVDAAISHYERAIRLAQPIGLRYAQVRVGVPLGYLLIRVGSSARALDQFQTAIAFARDQGWRLDEANALLGVGEAHARLRETKLALSHFRQALTMYRKMQSRQGQVNALVQIAETCRQFGHPRYARSAYQQSLELCDPGTVAAANAWDGLAEVEITLGNPAAAYDHLLEALAASGTGYPRGIAHAFNGLARLFADQADWATATEFYHAAAVAYHDLAAPVGAASAHSGLATCARQRNDSETQINERVAAVACIEQQRAAQIVHADQGEYFRRFGRYYELALCDALEFGRLDVFIKVFEAVAGRRLAGLAGRGAASSGTPGVVGQMAAHYRSDLPLGDPPPPDSEPQRRSLRRLGRVALWSALPGIAGEALDRELAHVFVPFDQLNPGELWDTVQARGEPALLLTLLRRLGQIAWLLIDPDDPRPRFGLHDLAPASLELLARLDRQGLPLDATPASVPALSDLLPPPAVEHLADGTRLTLIPADDLWAVPWAAVRGPNERFLGETFALRRSPSLTMLAAGQRNLVPSRVAWWRSPLVNHHRLAALAHRDPALTEPLATAAQAHRALVRGQGHDLVVVVAHGRPVPHLIHFIELDAETHLVPADFLTASPPPLLALISCWGATGPDRVAGDPLSVATLALARGSQAVAATTSELLDDIPSSTFVNFFLEACLRLPMPEALLEATQRWLRRNDFRDGYLSRWAPLAILAH